VEILTSSTQVPHKDWLKFVRTSRARAKIKHWIKVEEDRRSAEIGRRLLEVELKKHNVATAQLLKSEQFTEVARASGYDSADDLVAAVGYGRVASSQVVSRLLPHGEGEQQRGVQEPAAVPKAGGPKSDEKGVKVKGARDLLMQLSRCCNPVPGDRILGYITRGRGLTIHAVGCPNLDALDYDRDRLVEVDWDTSVPSTHDVKISVMAVDRPGVLANVSSSIAGCNANISRAEITTREDRKAVLNFVVEVTDTDHLSRVLQAVERVEGVISAKRLRAWQDHRASA
jgi:GTP pyrophosphokinase